MIGAAALVALGLAAGELTFETDLDAARERAARERKPMMVVFRCVP